MNKPFDQAEYEYCLRGLSSMPAWNTTTTKEVARKLLKSELIVCNGDIRDVKVKHLGLGVYKVYSEARKYP
jgi:hypothetical protein